MSELGRKLTSRQFWIAVAAFLGSIGAIFALSARDIGEELLRRVTRQ